MVLRECWHQLLEGALFCRSCQGAQEQQVAPYDKVEIFQVNWQSYHHGQQQCWLPSSRQLTLRE